MKFKKKDFKSTLINNAQIPIEPNRYQFKKKNFKFNKSKSRSNSKNKFKIDPQKDKKYLREHKNVKMNIIKNEKQFDPKAPIRKKEFKPIEFLDDKLKGKGQGKFQGEKNPHRNNLSTFQEFVLVNKPKFELLGIRVTSSHYLEYKNNIINNFMLYRSYRIDKYLKDIGIKGGMINEEGIPQINKEPINLDEQPIAEPNIESNVNVDKVKVENKVAEQTLQKQAQNDAQNIVKTVEVLETLKTENQEEFVNNFSPQILNYTETSLSKIDLDKSIFFPLNHATLFSGNRPKSNVSFADQEPESKHTMLGNYSNIFYSVTFPQSWALNASTSTDQEIVNRYNIAWATADVLAQARYNEVYIRTFGELTGHDFGVESLNTAYYWPGNNNYFHWHFETLTDIVSNPYFVKAPVLAAAINDYYFAKRRNINEFAKRIDYQDNYNLNSKTLSQFSIFLLGRQPKVFSMSWEVNMMKLLLYSTQYNLSRYIGNTNQHSKEQLMYSEIYQSTAIQVANVYLCYMTMGDFLLYRTNQLGIPQNYIFIPYSNETTTMYSILMYILSWLPYPQRIVYRYAYYTVNTGLTARTNRKGRIWNQASNITIPGQTNFILLAMDDYSVTDDNVDQARTFTWPGGNVNLIQYKRYVLNEVVVNLTPNIEAILTELNEDAPQELYRKILTFISDYNVLITKNVIDLIARITTHFPCSLFCTTQETYVYYDTQQFPYFNGLGQYPAYIQNVLGTLLCANSFQHVFYFRNFIVPSAKEVNFYSLPTDYQMFYDTLDAGMLASFSDYVNFCNLGTFYLNTNRINSYNNPTMIRLAGILREEFYASHLSENDNLNYLLVNVHHDVLRWPRDVQNTDIGYYYHNYEDMLAFWKQKDPYQEKARISVPVNELPRISVIEYGNNPKYFFGEGALIDDRLKIENWIDKVFRNCLYRNKVTIDIFNQLTNGQIASKYVLFPSMYLNAFSCFYDEAEFTGGPTWNFVNFEPMGIFRYILNYKRMWYPTDITSPRTKFRISFSDISQITEKYGVFHYKKLDIQPITQHSILSLPNDWNFLKKTKGGKKKEEEN